MTDVRLEPLSLAHLDGVMSWINDPEVTFYFANLSGEITREQEEAYLRVLLTSQTDKIFSIFENDEYVGQIGISKIYWPARNGRIGLMLKREAWGRGLSQVAIRLLIDKAFGDLNLHKLWVIIRADNEKGLYLWKKMGFTPEGILRDEYFVKGKFHNMVRLGLLTTDTQS